MTQSLLQQSSQVNETHSNGSVLEVSDLVVEFGSDEQAARAVDGTTFVVKAGEAFALVGESGSGKSITASAILGLLPPGATLARGSITLQGTELVGLKQKELRSFRGSHVGMIFQNPLSSLDPSFKIGNQLREIIRLHEPDFSKQRVAETAREWLKQVGIGDSERVLNSYPHELSGGMRQRVMIAIASLSQPALLIADEPTTALDAVIQLQILELLKSVVKSTGSSLLIITHDFGVVSYIADRVAVMRNGKIIEQGSKQDILLAPREPYTKTLIAAVPEVGARFALEAAGLSRRLGTREVPLEPIAATNRVNEAAEASQHPSSARTLLEVTHLSKEFVIGGWGTGQAKQRFKAVDDITIQIRRGEVFGLIGESGSGKSTFARLIGGLIPASSGSVRLDQSEITALRGRELRALRPRFQYIFQDATSSLNPRIPLGEQIARPLRRFGKVATPKQARNRVNEVLELVQLPAAYSERYPHELSGGQRQRIGIARALALEPELLVLDEPTSALDVSTQATILNLLLDLRDQLDLTYLFIGHNLAIIEFVCDRIGVLDHGRLVDQFEATELFAETRSPITRSLLEAILPVHREHRKI